MSSGGKWPVLKRLEDTHANVDELDYLAKWLASFDVGEAAQFQAMAEKLELRSMTDLINLTFCCQRATVITDFSNLEAVGREHYMNLQGAVYKEELDALDGYETALLLIDSGAGVVTPYGVVYDNGILLSPVYDGRSFPPFWYDRKCMMEAAITADNREEPVDMVLPMPDKQLERMLLREELAGASDLGIHVKAYDCPDAAADIADYGGETLESVNRMCQAVSELHQQDMKKFQAALSIVNPSTAQQVSIIAKHLDLFDFIPNVKSPEEYGRYMIRESGKFEYDENLEGFYDYKKFGLRRIDEEQGQLTDFGYIAYKGETPLDELLGQQDSNQTVGMQMM